MGVLLSKMKVFHKNKSPPAIKAYSWEVRNNSNMPTSDYLLENVKSNVECRIPGSINGQQFIIQNCSNSKIFVFDYTNTVIVDDCSQCLMIFGPVKRRDCENCKIIVACEQFRLRDCKNLEISLYCATRPIIESSKNIKFSCFQLFYNGIQEHFHNCNLNPWNNMWYKIHDYTPANKNDYANWNFGDIDVLRMVETLPEPIQQLNISTSRNTSFVPLTLGVLANTTDQQENCLVVFCDDYSAKSFLHCVYLNKVNVNLIKSRQCEINARHAESLFFTSSLVNAIQHSPVIGLSMYGKNAINTCSRVINECSETSLYYVSPTTNMASHQVNTFFSIADLEMESYS